MKVTGLEHYRAQFAKLHQVFPTITMQVRQHCCRLKRRDG